MGSIVSTYVQLFRHLLVSIKQNPRMLITVDKFLFYVVHLRKNELDTISVDSWDDSLTAVNGKNKGKRLLTNERVRPTSLTLLHLWECMEEFKKPITKLVSLVPPSRSEESVCGSNPIHFSTIFMGTNVPSALWNVLEEVSLNRFPRHKFRTSSHKFNATGK